MLKFNISTVKMLNMYGKGNNEWVGYVGIADGR